ncbi:CD109 antigen-like isoform X1 [Castor canadensis]|uniref:CD109 antigen-like n=5 Tax=Castor canadensis TaxID=51338 RepID=A0AC58M0U9_CASCN
MLTFLPLSFWGEKKNITKKFKPSLNFTATVKATRSDTNRLTPEERNNNVVIAVTQRNSTSSWTRWSSGNQETENARPLTILSPKMGSSRLNFQFWTIPVSCN